MRMRMKLMKMTKMMKMIVVAIPVHHVGILSFYHHVLSQEKEITILILINLFV